MKKYILAFLIFSLFLIAGCMKASVILKIERNGSGEIGFRLAMNEGIYNMTKEQSDPFEEWRKDLKREGYKVKDYRKEGFVGIEAVKKTNDVVKEFDKFRKAGEKNLFRDLRLEKDSNLLFAKYSLKGDVDLTSLSLGDLGDSEEAKKLEELALSQVKINLVVKLPQKPRSHNATSVSKDGKELTWDFTPGKKSEVKMNVTILNLPLIYTSVGAVLVIFLVLIFAIYRLIRKLKKPKTAE